jgi:hypothetical protein
VNAEKQMTFVRLTAAAKRALAEEIVRMAGCGNPEARIAELLKARSENLLNEFEEVQAEWLRVPMWDLFGQQRPAWKIDPQEAWDRDCAQTESIRAANRAQAMRA